MAKVPVKPEVSGSKVLVIFRYPWSRLMVLVTLTATAAVWSPLTMVAGLPVMTGVPKVQPAGGVGRAGSVTVQTMPAPNGPTVSEAPAARLTVPEAPLQL